MKYILKCLTGLLLATCTLLAVGCSDKETYDDTLPDSFNVDGVFYKRTSVSTVMVVKNDNYSGDIVIPDSVTYGRWTYKVTAVDDYAFMSNTQVRSISLPQSITYFGYRAFYHCENAYIAELVIDNEDLVVKNAAFIGTRIKKLVLKKYFSMGRIYSSTDNYQCGSFTIGYIDTIDFLLTQPNPNENSEWTNYVIDIETYGPRRCVFINHYEVAPGCTRWVGGSNGNWPYYCSKLLVPKGSTASYSSHNIWGQIQNIIEDENITPIL